MRAPNRMRMAGPDIVLFVIGALLFGGAAYAIVASPEGIGDSASPVGVFEVAYQTQPVELETQTVPSLRSATLTFDVSEQNVSQVELTVLCTGPGGDVGPVAFQLAVDVQGPGGQTGSGTGSCGAGVVVQVPVAQPPVATVVRADTESEAREAVSTDANATAAVGTWTVTVTGSRGGATGPLPVDPTDPGGMVVMSAETWTPRFTPVQR